MELEHFESLYPERTRYDQIEKILSFIKEGSSCQVVSVPGVGRSNLLGFLAYNKKVRTKHLGVNQKNFHFVYLNFSEIRKKPLVEATKFIFLNLADSLKERKMLKEYEVINKIFKDSLSVNDELVIFSGLKKTIDFLALEKNLTIILLYDRFEDYIGVLDSEFFANLRVLRNRAKYKFSVVFSLNRPLEEVLEPTLFSDFYEFVAGKIVYLPLFDKTGVDFRIAYLEKITGKKLDKKLLDEVFQLTGGHSNLMRLCAESLLSAGQKFENKLMLRRFFLEQKPVRSALFAIWNFLTPSEQTLLASSNQQLATSSQDLTFLEKLGLIKENLITISLFSDYLKEKMQNLKADEKITISETGEIVKGSINISEKLTSLEFKLLKFMLSNKDRVLEKEEIINAVWGEQKTTLGVTDQALDQLIFRLRKKIEENPNSPVFILTVKGRGFKFSS